MHTLLFADDDPDIRAIADLSLRVVGGFQVTLASSGREALAMALRQTPDLILLDMMMPGMDGLETLRHLRSHPELTAVPVVFMTAKVQARDRDEMLAAGALGVIAKPFDPMDLPTQVRRFVMQHA